MTTPYQRPVLSTKDEYDAKKTAEKLIRKYGLAKLPYICQLLVLENARLVKEIQEHRAARDFEPLETFEA